jgi:hypothetical protein
MTCFANLKKTKQYSVTWLDLEINARWKGLIVGKFGQSKCVARPVAKEIDKMKCEEEPLLLPGVALFIVKYMPANTKPVGRNTWRRLDK